MIFVLATSRDHGKTFLKNNPNLGSDLVVKIEETSRFNLINEIISECQDPFACIVNADVILRQEFKQKLNGLVVELNKNWKNWGLVGNAGISPVAIGFSSSRVIRYLYDPNGGPNLAGTILPTINIGSSVMLLNIAALKDLGVKLPILPGSYLCSAALSIEIIAAGLSVLVAPQLACWNGRSEGLQGDDDLTSAHDLDAYLGGRLKNTILPTLAGDLRITNRADSIANRPRLDLEINGLSNAAKYREPKKLAIVVRTQFRRPGLLRRTLETLTAFIASSDKEATHLDVYLVTDQPNVPELYGSMNFRLISAEVECGVDSRFLLIRTAIRSIEADFFWFIDDDDWLFPNEAKRLSQIISIIPSQSLIFLGCQNFHEKIEDDSQLGIFPRVTRGRYYPAHEFMKSVTGLNHTPFSGVIFPKNSLSDIPDEAFYSITYLEDFFLLQRALYCGDFIPVVVDKLYVGISIRESGNTVTEVDRTKWNKSMADVVAQLVEKPFGSLHILSLQRMISSYYSEPEPPRKKFLVRFISKLKKTKIRRVIGVLMDWLSGKVSLRKLIKKI